MIDFKSDFPIAELAKLGGRYNPGEKMKLNGRQKKLLCLMNQGPQFAGRVTRGGNYTVSTDVATDVATIEEARTILEKWAHYLNEYRGAWNAAKAKAEADIFGPAVVHDSIMVETPDVLKSPARDFFLRAFSDMPRLIPSPFLTPPPPTGKPYDRHCQSPA